MEGREAEAKAEDWCFICKDGGDLILCNNGNCSKVYHLECLLDCDSDSEISSHNIQEDWSCECHSCSSCQQPSEFYCFCCPTSFCNICIKSVNFVHLRPNKGLCTDCLTLVRLAEKLSFSKKAVDFQDRDTHECLFKEYWDIVKEEEGLSRDDLVSRSSNKGTRQMKPTPVPNTLQDTGSISISMSKSKSKSKSKSNNNTHKFEGWGSKPLIEFLTSFGVDSTKQLSPSEVSSIILKYVQENDLIHPINNKKVICDRPLHLIFKKNTVSMKHINLLLGPHLFHVNNGIANKRSCLHQPLINGDDVSLNKHHKTLSSSGEEDKPRFALVVPHNINLVYLRRSLVEDLLKQPESFKDKVVGSFVKIMDTNSTQRKISQHLLQVTAVNEMSSKDGRSIVLHVWRLPNIPISMLSDSDLTEEDCKDLMEKMEKGLLQRPTVEEIEKKAQILHHDILKNLIEKELANLQNLIDRANEKGRRSELYQLIEQRQRLKKEADQQSPLLKQLPTVIADTIDVPT